AAESLPFVETVHPSLKKQIQEGKDINLAALLIPYFNCMTDQSNSNANCCKEKPDPRLNNVLSLSQFIQAFGIYKNIMCMAHPQRRPELDLYERDIIDMSSRYGGSGFYEYHKTFSAQAAAHLRFNNVKVDWSFRNNTLFCSIFTNYRANACTLCGSTLHASQFCPRHVYDKVVTPPEHNSIVPRSTFNAGSSTARPNSNTDIWGRQRLTHNGKEICNNFNSNRGCALQKCRNIHVCSSCKQNDHAAIKCQTSKNWQGQRIPTLR
ncbi:MAG: hypothetical protein ABW185_06725, partial [Sedimenticola sp.]